MTVAASVLRRALVVFVLLLGGCAGPEPEPPRQYVLEGQVLAVLPDQMALTVRHEAIPDLMAAMTMTFPVAERGLLEGRAPGETITATLEVRNGVGRLVSITHTGNAPLPPPSRPAPEGTAPSGQ